MSLYEELLCEIKNGSAFSINLNDKKLKINGKNIDLEEEKHNLITDDDLITEGIDKIISEDFYEIVKLLYEKYKKSTPSLKNKKSYFKALKADELTDFELINGLNRNYAQFILEAYILLYSIQYKDKINWDDNKWFYQGEDKSLVLLKKWL